MSDPSSTSANGSDRRLLLVDFDWQDADLMPELLQRPGVSVRLVAGAQHDDAGIRLAELCGLPRTVDLADLTREIFDLALVSERSPRRTQIEGLLLALGTPSVTPQAFLAGEPIPVSGPSPGEGPTAADAPAFEQAVGGGDLDRLMEEALPDIATPVTGGPEAGAPKTAQSAPQGPPPAKAEPVPAAASAEPSAPEPEDRPTAPGAPPAPAPVHAPAAPAATGPAAVSQPAAPVPPAAVTPPAAAAEPDSAPPRPATVSLEEFPSPEDRHGLEQALRALMESTGTRRAELHLVAPDQSETVLELGPDDALLGGLVGLARQLGGPQVVGGLTGQQAGKAWGAWPFRTVQRHGVIAAGGIDPVSGWTAWERTVAALRAEWDRRDRELAGPAFPLLPVLRPRWLAAEEFATRIELAVERNRRDGLRFSLHQIHFSGSAPAVEALCADLPGQMRETDCLTRPSPMTVVLLTAGDPATFPHVRRRLVALWERAWNETGGAEPAPAFMDAQARLTVAADAPTFAQIARDWSGGTT